MEGSALERLVVDLARSVRERFYGKYRGLVEQIDDPNQLGRIKVRVPEVLGDEVSPWAFPCSPYTGPNQGFYAIPPVGTGVWVEFEAGDPSRPIWSGAWWGKDDLPKDETAAQTDTPKKVFRSGNGLVLVFDDDANSIALSDSNGSNLVKIKVNEGTVRVQATTKVVVEGPQIELVDGAMHPLVFGDDLLTYLNQLVMTYTSHIHPGETVLGIPVTPAPPVAPFPPAQPTMLSLKVKTG